LPAATTANASAAAAAARSADVNFMGFSLGRKSSASFTAS
jgi:hypothetical protein